MSYSQFRYEYDSPIKPNLNQSVSEFCNSPSTTPSNVLNSAPVKNSEAGISP